MPQPNQNLQTQPVPQGQPLFTEQQRNRMLHFLGYPDWQSVAQSIQLGYPAASEPLFLVYDSFFRMNPATIPTVLQDLCECEAVEAQLSDARSRMKAMQLGDLKTNPQETRQLRQELTYWTRRLADDLGVNPNPYSQMNYYGYGGGVNAKIVGGS
jgi:hypothetical protein